MNYNTLNPPAIVREAFDEQQLKREWDEAVGDEQDAVSRQQAVLRKALARWPMVLSSNPGARAQGKMTHSPEMRRFVRDVLGMPDRPHGGMSARANRLLKEGGREHDKARSFNYSRRVMRIRHAVVELVTKYRLGADPKQCMEALANFYEEQASGKA
jgi:hypothetical protein